MDGGDSLSGDCVVQVTTVTSCPPAIVSASLARFEFESESGRAPLGGFECQLADEDGDVGSVPMFDWRQCESGFEATGLVDGSYQFAVRVQGEGVEGTCAFSVDQTPPVTTLLDGPLTRVPGKDVNL